MAVQGTNLDGTERLGSFFQAHQREFNRLQDPDRSVRRAALETFKKLLAPTGAGTVAPDGPYLEALCASGLLPPFLQLLSDPVEKCRELALGIMQAVTSKLPQVGTVMDQVMPPVRARIGVSPVAETSEEVRLQLVALLADSLLPRCTQQPSQAAAQDVAAVLSQVLQDPFHEIKKAACRGIVAGARQCPGALAPHAEGLMKALLQNVAHPHSRVRTAVLQALDGVVATGGLPAGSLTDVLPPGIKPLAFDKAAAVRQLLFSSIAHWLGAPSGSLPLPPPPAFDPQPYVLDLLPLLLVGVTDPSSDIASRTLELAEQKVVATHLRELLRPLQKELREWTVALRQGAARVLHTVLVLGGENVTGHVDVIVPMLCAAVGDEDADVAKRIVSCGHVVGAAVRPAMWVPIMGDELTAPRASAAQKANRLVVLAALLHATEEGGLAAEHVAQIAQIVAGEELRCAEHAAVRTQLLAVVTNLVRAAGPACGPVTLPLLQTLLQLQATPNDVPLQHSAAEVTSALARATGHSSVSSLFSEHLSGLLATATADHAQWVSVSPGWQLFQALLHAAGAAAGPGLEQALPVLAGVVQQEREAALRISALQLVDELLEVPALAATWRRRAARLLAEMLVPCGVWRAGKVAAAVRHAAMVATGTLLRNDLCTQEDLLGVLSGSSLLAVVRSCLEEDYYVDTRRAACHVAEHLVRVAGPALSGEQRRALYKDVLKRLDDSNDEIRIEITGAARQLFASLPPHEDGAEVRELVDGMLVHMDDPDARVQAAVCSALEVAARVRGVQVEEAVRKVMQKHRSQVYCARVLAAAEATH
ncbi:hypothetical protein KFL_000010760 [Klebsormidium nitens]|uniref:TOG domain-containing protein n=1 Tax=Klebsormidium nitens TaxID=105231 RepID=A0A0U9HTD3_KLENI|nr:hypothetical protein KFL_000010760 [Klebsormidium nitens]|eukprot:GAQ77627.1 hypothetical protein KFL_000010760 [Klebsormidium nitens]